MFAALQKVKIPTIIFTLLFIALWSIFSSVKQNYQEAQAIYTMQDFSQDASKIYFDMGVFAQKRTDWQTAIKFYQIALEHNQECHEAEHSLKMCIAQEREFKNKNL